MATVQLFLDRRRSKSDSTFPLKLRIGFGKKAKLFSTQISLKESDFIKLIAGKGKFTSDLIEVQNYTEAILRKAKDIILTLDPFCIDKFSTRYLQKGNRLDLIYLLNEKGSRLIVADKIGNGNLYLQTAALLSAYCKEQKKHSELILNTVTVNFLSEFEKWTLSQLRQEKSGDFVNRYSKTTLGMYLIRVRSIFNDAISEQMISGTLYPFHRPQNNKGYKIPKASGNKRALSKEDIIKLSEYSTINKNEAFARDIFIFSYLSSGMNCIDIFRLKWSGISENDFKFIRRKTESKLGESCEITILLNDKLKSIIELHGSDKNNNTYVFNVIAEGSSEVDMLKSVRSAISMINFNLKKIAKDLGITQNISTYFARHSFSTNLMNNEVPISYISKQLGHSSLKTTESYLSSFDTSKSLHYVSDLL
ncbi:tyrosine-type recombinase/integrase [Pedobacter sp.]|uniref:site-specific integrase n=1 Tax=Pedobacter sp. TaxID=1411316 RepID=UPI003BABAB88